MRILTLLGLIVFSFACDSSKTHRENTNNLNYSLEITDSIQIDKLIGNHSIVASHPENGNLLMLSKEGDNQIVHIISQEGEIIKEFEHTSEGPLSAGIILISATFFEDGYALMGVGNIVTYDADFNVKRELKSHLV